MPDEVKKEPRSQDANCGAPDGKNAGEPTQPPARRRSGFREPGQTGSADDALVVFSDTLAAEKAAALRTLRGRFAIRVMKTSLEGERCHGQPAPSSLAVAGAVAAVSIAAGVTAGAGAGEGAGEGATSLD